MKRSLHIGCISQTECVGSSHANMSHMKMCLWLLACRDWGDPAVFIPFPPWSRSYIMAAMSALQQGNSGEWLSGEWVRAVLKYVKEA